MRDIRIESPLTRKLRQTLEDERDRILNAVALTIREGRTEGAMDDSEVQDDAERSEADVQTELEFALLQTYGDTLGRITEALDRLDAGGYGFCADCGAQVGAERLSALPFATRCLPCEQRREMRYVGSPSPKWRDAAHMLEMRR